MPNSQPIFLIAVPQLGDPNFVRSVILILHHDPGLFLSGSNDTLRAFLKKGKRPFRLVLGYAGWAAGQLEKEMAEGAWIAAGASAKHVLQTDPAETWKAVLQEMGIDPANIALGHGIH